MREFRSFVGSFPLPVFPGLLLLLSCSDERQARVTCTEFAACGGDVVGTWSFQGFCGEERLTLPTCTTPVTYDPSGLQVTGDETYSADRMLAAHLSVTGAMTMHFPRECLTLDGAAFGCAALDMTFMSMMDPTHAVQSVRCSDEAGGCLCRAEMKTTLDLTGTYALDGNALVVTASDPDATPVRNDYCVSGDTLTIRPGTPAVGTLDLTGVTDVLVKR